LAAAASTKRTLKKQPASGEAPLRVQCTYPRCVISTALNPPTGVFLAPPRCCPSSDILQPPISLVPAHARDVATSHPSEPPRRAQRWTPKQVGEPGTSVSCSDSVRDGPRATAILTSRPGRTYEDRVQIPDVPGGHQDPPHGFVREYSNVRVLLPTPANDLKHETPQPRPRCPYSQSSDNSGSSPP